MRLQSGGGGHDEDGDFEQGGRCLRSERQVVRPGELQAYLAEAEICREGDPAGAGQSKGFPRDSAGSKCARKLPAAGLGGTVLLDSD